MLNRRKFVEQSSILGAGIGFAPFVTRQKLGKYRVAIIGAGWWGNNILYEAMASGRTKVVGICDVDQLAIKQTVANVQKETGDSPKVFVDYREMFQKIQADIVIVASPDHWHALGAIAAIHHGAHVYIEKPISHTVLEGKAILDAARSANRIVQVGTHRRVSSHNISAMEYLHSGQVGDISLVKCFVNYGQGRGKPRPDEEPPTTLDWDKWVGPAQLIPYHRGIHPKGFRQYLNFANGMIADWGIHWFDQVLWWTEERAPHTIYSTGTRNHRKDNADAPDTQVATFEFESFTLQWEHMLSTPNVPDNHDVGCYFYGTKGTLHLGWRDGWTFYPKNRKKEVINTPPILNQPDEQNIKELWADFIHAIENDRLPVCDIEHGYLATNISLLAMISMKVGRSIKWDHDQTTIINDPAANVMLKREYRAGYTYPE